MCLILMIILSFNSCLQTEDQVINERFLKYIDSHINGVTVSELDYIPVDPSEITKIHKVIQDNGYKVWLDRITSIRYLPNTYSLPRVQVNYDLKSIKENGTYIYRRISIGVKEGELWKFVTPEKNNQITDDIKFIDTQEFRALMPQEQLVRTRLEYKVNNQDTLFTGKRYYYENGDYEDLQISNDKVLGGKLYNSEDKLLVSYIEHNGQFVLERYFMSSDQTYDSMLIYDSNKFLVTSISPVKEYSKNGNLTKHINSKGEPIHYKYEMDTSGKLVKVEITNGRTKEVSYFNDETVGLKEKSSLETGKVFEVEQFDSNGNLIESSKPLRRIKTNYTYNVLSQPTLKTSLQLHKDQWHRVLEEKYFYDSEERLEKVTVERRSGSVATLLYRHTTP